MDISQRVKKGLVRLVSEEVENGLKFIFKHSLREVKNWQARLVSEGKKWASETCLTSLENGLVRLVSEGVKMGL